MVIPIIGFLFEGIFKTSSPCIALPYLVLFTAYLCQVLENSSAKMPFDGTLTAESNKLESWL